MKNISVSEELYDKLEEEVSKLREGTAEFVQGPDLYEGKKLQIVKDDEVTVDSLAEKLLEDRIRYHKHMREFRNDLFNMSEEEVRNSL